MKKDDKHSLFGKSRDNDLFALPEGEAMNSDVTDAARILRSFVSQVGGETGDDAKVFPLGEGEAMSSSVSVAPESDASSSSSELDQYIESASAASRSLDDEVPRIQPRMVSPSGEHASRSDASLTNQIRLVFKGKATKRQLERLRKKVVQRVQSRSSLDAVSGSWERSSGK